MESNKCKYCAKGFSTRSNLLKHYRNMHEAQAQSLEKKIKASHVCKECGNSFESMSSLNRHKRNKHQPIRCDSCDVIFKSQKELNIHVQQSHDESLESISPSPKKKKGVQCRACPEMFSCNSTMFRHMRKKHAVEPDIEKPANLECPECSASFRNFALLDRHLEKDHKLHLEHNDPKFLKTMEEFQKWKREIEETQVSYFYLRNSRDDVKYYRCNRSGQSKRQNNNEERMKCAPGTKTGKACPARIILRSTESGYIADFQACHVGHTLSAKYLRLTKEERTELAGKLENKIPMDVILDDIYDQVQNFPNLTRYQATTRKDLHNIMREFNLVPSKLCRDDFTSTETWVRTQQALGEDDCCVIGYKLQGTTDPCGILQDDDFILIIMTKYQRNVLLKFINDKVLMDNTHRTAGYDLQLTSLVIIDEYDTGCPVAFCLSSRVDTNTMSYFLLQIRSKVGSLKTDVFMSDDANSYYNAWIKVMNTPTHKLLCTWHVDKNWRNNIKSKIYSEERQADVYKGCRLLLETLNEEEFYNNLEIFLYMCENDPETKKFYEYFRSNYANRPQVWAYCFRKKMRLNTNRFLEALHKKLRHCYLDGKQNRQVDKCIDMLLGFIKRLMFTRLDRNMMNIPSYRMNNIEKSHKRSLQIKEDMIKLLDDNIWEVQSSRTGSGPYLVKVDDTISCDGCPLTCTECKICFHQFECTCIDFSITGNFCKHIHACIRSSMEMLSDLHNENASELFEAEAQAISSSSKSLPTYISHVDNREKLKSLLDSIYAVSTNIQDSDLQNICSDAEHLLDQVKAHASSSVASTSHTFHCTTARKHI